MGRIECLDGLRGLAALWVLVGHCMLLTGFMVPILSKPDLGVDLFILLSGFLMTFQYNLRKTREDWHSPNTWVTFWVRRFFRISPLYFLLLATALAAGPTLYSYRIVIDTFLQNSLQAPERYNDHSIANILTHVTFVFGLIPRFAFRTALPDWSIGLEMQFYLVFPLFVVLARQWGWFRTAICFAVVSIGIAATAKLLHIIYPMPSFLPLKLHIFIAGMLIAVQLEEQRARHLLLALAMVVIPIGGEHDVLHIGARAMLATTFFALVHCRQIGHIDTISRVLGSAPFRALGELSFGVYLIHLMILQVVASLAIAHWGTSISAGALFAMTLSIVAPLSYALACFTYVTIELPGQRLGRRLLNMGRSKGKS